VGVSFLGPFPGAAPSGTGVGFDQQSSKSAATPTNLSTSAGSRPEKDKRAVGKGTCGAQAAVSASSRLHRLHHPHIAVDLLVVAQLVADHVGEVHRHIEDEASQLPAVPPRVMKMLSPGLSAWNTAKGWLRTAGAVTHPWSTLLVDGVWRMQSVQTLFLGQIKVLCGVPKPPTPARRGKPKVPAFARARMASGVLAIKPFRSRGAGAPTRGLGPARGSRRECRRGRFR